MGQKIFLLVACGSLTVFIGMGLRQSLGLFLHPVSQDLGVGRELFSFAIALSNLISGLPVFAMAADRFGARLILVVGGLVYTASFLALSLTTTGAGLYLSLGILMGIAQSSVSHVVVLGAVGKAVPLKRRSSIFGMVCAISSLGTVLIVPAVQWLLSSIGWRQSLTFISASTLGIVAFASCLPRHSKNKALSFESGQTNGNSFSKNLISAYHHRGYLLLNLGFFVCGFHVTFIAMHLPAYLMDNGLPPMLSASVLSLIGLFNVFGSSAFGFLGDRFRKKILLSMLYFSRAVLITLFLIIPLSEISALVFGGAIGFLWLATVPLTSGIVAQIFGSKYLSTLYGIVFFSHQLGSFSGVWLGGWIYDTTGSYQGVWMIAIVLGVLSSLVHLPINDCPTHQKDHNLHRQ